MILDTVKVAVINDSTNKLPEYSTSGAAAMDIRADVILSGDVSAYGAKSGYLPKTDTESDISLFSKDLVDGVPCIIIPSLCRAIVATGLRIATPINYKLTIKPRSGLAIKHGITMVNSPGTIDSDYRGDVGLLLINLSAVPFVIKQGDRMGQLELESVISFEWDIVTKLEDTVRGIGGMGHTGVK